MNVDPRSLAAWASFIEEHAKSVREFAPPVPAEVYLSCFAPDELDDLQVQANMRDAQRRREADIGYHLAKLKFELEHAGASSAWLESDGAQAFLSREARIRVDLTIQCQPEPKRRRVVDTSEPWGPDRETVMEVFAGAFFYCSGSRQDACRLLNDGLPTMNGNAGYRPYHVRNQLRPFSKRYLRVGTDPTGFFSFAAVTLCALKFAAAKSLWDDFAISRGGKPWLIMNDLVARGELLDAHAAAMDKLSAGSSLADIFKRATDGYLAMIAQAIRRGERQALCA